jgi:hypothetical protein
MEYDRDQIRDRLRTHRAQLGRVRRLAEREYTTVAEILPRVLETGYRWHRYLAADPEEHDYPPPYFGWGIRIKPKDAVDVKFEAPPGLMAKLQRLADENFEPLRHVMWTLINLGTEHWREAPG